MGSQPRARVGLIGYGFAGRVFHAPLIRATPELELVAVATRDSDAVVRDLGSGIRITDADSLIDDDGIDCIVIATPNDSHAPLATRALRAGKHVVIDKPFAIDLASARDVAALAEDRGLLLSIFHNRRWDSDFLSIRRIIEDGHVGEVRQFESHFDRFRPEVRDRWRERPGSGSGVWFDLGPHLVDQALLLFGLPERVSASLAAQRIGSVTDDWAHVVLEFDALRVVLHASMIAAGGFNRFTVHGTAGSAVKQCLDRQETQLLAGVVPGSAEWGSDPDPVILFSATGEETLHAAERGDQRRFYSGWARAMTGQAPVPVAPAEALAVMAVIEAAAQSAAEHRAVVPAVTDRERSAWQR